MKTITMHYKAKNDVNGNPRRCYVVYDSLTMPVRNIVAVYNEKYMGIRAIRVEKHRNVIDSIEVPISTYNEFIKLGKELGEEK